MSRSSKLNIAQALAAPLASNGREFDLIDFARCAGASDRFVQSFDELERIETIVRQCRSFSGDSPPLRRLVDLARHQLDLARLEVDAALDRDEPRALRLRRRYWLARDEHCALLERLNDELGLLLG